jgi:hypothetical protein
MTTPTETSTDQHPAEIAPGDRVRLSARGIWFHTDHHGVERMPSDRRGTVTRVASNGERVVVRWDGVVRDDYTKVDKLERCDG